MKYFILLLAVLLIIGVIVLWLKKDKREGLNLPPTSSGYNFRIDFGGPESEDLGAIAPRYKEKESSRKWDKTGWY